MSAASQGPAAVLPPRPVLTDGVVLLREPVGSDVPAITHGAGQPSVAEFTRVPSPYSEADAVDFVALVHAGWAEATMATFAICSADEPDRLLGLVGLHDVDLTGDPGGAAEIGYWICEEARGRGLTTRAARMLCSWAIDELGLTRIDWYALVGNEASRHVAESVGFRVEGLVRRGALRRTDRLDHWIGGLLAEELLR